MSGFQLLASLVDSLAWPLAAVVAVLFLRKHLAALFHSVERGRQLRRAKVGPVEVEWEPVIEQVLYNVSAVEPAPPVPPPPMPPAPAQPAPPPTSPAPAADYEAAEEWEEVSEPDVRAEREPGRENTRTNLRDLIPLADSQPAAAVAWASTLLDTSTLEMMRNQGVQPFDKENQNLTSMLREAVSQHAISPELAESIRGLRELRDVALNESSADLVTPARAVQYVAATEAVLDAVNKSATPR